MTDWCQFLGEVCSNALLSVSSDNYKLGGKDIIVEIDETLISKKKILSRKIL